MTELVRLSDPGATIDTLLTTVKDSNLSATHKITRSATLVIAASDSSAKGKAQADYVCDGTADNVEIQAALDSLPTVGGSVVFLEGNYQISAKVSIPSKTVIYFINATFTLANGVNACMFSNVHGRGTCATLLLDRAIEDNDIYIYGVGCVTLDGNRANQTTNALALISLIGVDRFAVENITCNNSWYNGVECVPCIHGTIKNIRGYNNYNCTVAIEAGEVPCDDIIIDNIYCDTPGNASIWMSGVDNIYLSNIYSKNAVLGIMIKNLDPNVGAANPAGINNVRMKNIRIDGATGTGIRLATDSAVNGLKDISIDNFVMKSTANARGIYTIIDDDVDVTNVSIHNIDIETGYECVIFGGPYSSKISNWVLDKARLKSTASSRHVISVSGTKNGHIRDACVYGGLSDGIRIDSNASNIFIDNPIVSGIGTFGIAVASSSNVHIKNPITSNTYGRVIDFRTGCANCSTAGGSLTSTQTAVVENVTGNTDVTISCRGLNRTQLTDAGTRTVFNGVGVNAGDPNSAGAWAGYGYEGLIVIDTTASPDVLYMYSAGQWIPIGTAVA